MHNYLKRLVQLQAAGKIPAASLSHAFVAHDDWCGIFKGRECNCDPEIQVKRHVRERPNVSDAKGPSKCASDEQR